MFSPFFYYCNDKKIKNKQIKLIKKMLKCKNKKNRHEIQKKSCIIKKIVSYYETKKEISEVKGVFP